MTHNTKESKFFQLKLTILVVFALIVPFLSFSQSLTTPAHIKKAITAEFVFDDVVFEEIAVISNVLKIKNNNAKTYVFSVAISLPTGWRTLNNTNVEYTLSPNDSLFVPVRILTQNKSAKGGTKYNINAFIATNEGRQMALASFRAGRPKVSDWHVTVLPRPRIYFLNNENDASFQIELANNGDEPQELLLSMNKVGKDFLVADGTGKFLKKNYSEFTLAPLTDTLVSFTAQVQKPERNMRRIDNYGYLPNAFAEERHFGLFIKASEVGVKPGTGNSKNSKIDFVKLGNSINFIKLSNATRLNQYGSSTFPLTLQANAFNVMGDQPILNVVLNGNTQLNKKSTLNYFFQSGFTYYKLGKQTKPNSGGVLMYNHEKFFVSVGSTVGLNMDNLRGMVNGRGISGGYRITPNHTVGTYFIRNGLSFSNYSKTSVGGAYSARLNKVKFGLGYNRSFDTSAVTNTSDAVNGIFTTPLGRYQNLSINGRYTVYNFINVAYSSRMAGLNYRVNYLKGKANSSVYFFYMEGANTTNNSILIRNNTKNYRSTLTNSYAFKNGFILRLVDNYSSFQTTQTIIPQALTNNLLFTNILYFLLPPKASVSYTPGIYFNYSDYFTEKMISSGLQLNVNSYKMDQNFRVGFFAKAGYNRLLKNPELGTFFNGQANTVVSYRTWNLTVRYIYGPIGQGFMVKTLSEQKKYPQNLGGSIGNQYQFKNRHFIWENTFNYGFFNANQRHNLGWYSQLFYYTDNGWRFNINYNYSYNISSGYNFVYSAGAMNNAVAEPSKSKTTSHNYMLGLGAKKDFAIPIPKRFRKTRFCDAHYKVFLDINGNKKFDNGEIPLENIVIRMNDYEVLSNELGEASFINMQMGLYKLQVLPLVDVGAWFPVAPDSLDVCGPAVMYIPFSKGVEILGNVVIDRERFSAGMIDKIDISRIKIFLIDTLGNSISAITDNRGNFKFYVPYGQYTLKFDEKILGNDFELAENDVPVDLTDGMESYYHTFFIIQKKRKVKNKKFAADGSVIETESEADSFNKMNQGNNKPDNNNNKNKVFKDENSSGTNENVENAKTFKKDKADADKNKSEPTKQTEPVENLKTFGTPVKDETGNGDPNKIKNSINWAQMDSLIKILVGKIDVDSEISPEDLARIEESKVTKGDLSQFANKTVYTIQIGAYNSGLPKNVLAEILKLNVKVESFKDEKDGLTKYFTGYYDNYDVASNNRTMLESRGLVGPFLIAIHNGEIMSVQELLKKEGK